MIDRRKFLKAVGQTSAAIAAAGVGVESALGADKPSAAATAATGSKRATECMRIRYDAAQANFVNTQLNQQHASNGDELLYPNRIGSYTKGLPHNSDGTVVPQAYDQFTAALRSGDSQQFNSIPLAGPRKLVNPQAGLAFDLEGSDSHSLLLPPAPAFASREQAAELAENYWMALLRDVPFSSYSSHPMAAAAAADLTQFGSDMKAPKQNGQITPQTLFRGLTPGDTAGPYLSQFFYQPSEFGANEVVQLVRTSIPGHDYMTNFDSGTGSWLDIQNGYIPSDNVFDTERRYMRNGRDLGQWVHVDVLFQAYFNAFLILNRINAPVDEGNPYRNNPTQDGFGTFGPPHIAALLAEVSTRALKAVWFQKWFVHRRQRPEAFACRVDRALNHGAGYPVHADILTSLSTQSRLGGYMTSGNSLLPMAFPEGSPMHPSYGAGHATVAGACVTILKAWFDESASLLNLGAVPLTPTDDGFQLVPYSGDDAGSLTVGGELNKIASNVAIGRNIAGVHWRSDGTESLRLGEAVAISLLRDHRSVYNEQFNGFRLTKFNGQQVVV